MNKAIEIGAMILGSVSLLVVSFLGFAMLSGVPLHEVAVVGGLFEAPDSDDPETENSVDPMLAGAPEASRPQKTDDRVVQGSLGLMSAYSLPSPYTQSELQELAEELKGRALQLESREQELDRRDETLQEMEDSYENRLAALQDMQGKLESFQRELLLREKEVESMEDDALLGMQRKFAEIGRVLEGFELADRVPLLVEYPPEEAALILSSMTDDARLETLSGLGESLTPDRVKTFVEAYSEAAEAQKR